LIFVFFNIQEVDMAILQTIRMAIPQSIRRWAWNAAKSETVDRLSNIGFEALKTALPDPKQTTEKTNPKEMIEIRYSPRSASIYSSPSSLGGRVLRAMRDSKVAPMDQDEAILAMLSKAEADPAFIIIHKVDHKFHAFMGARNTYTEIRRRPPVVTQAAAG
jgi:hypothetical protein